MSRGAQGKGDVTTLIVGFPPGGPVDLLARLLAEHLGPLLASVVVVENRVGASGRIAASAVVAAPATGRTLLLTPGAMITLHPHLYRDLPYEPLAQLAPLLRVTGAQFVSLQQHETIPEGYPLIPVVDDCDSVDTTAAIVQQLDLVIAVDTMVAHLAGGLGRPVWTLHKLAADWRWMAGREDSPWYPTMRLFRQRRLLEWREVFDEIAQELSGLVKRGRQA